MGGGSCREEVYYDYFSAGNNLFASLVQLLSNTIEFFYGLTVNVGIPSYGLAIILFTVVIKIILFPLTAVQVKSTRKMQEVQPKIKEIQEKHKNNKQKQQEVMMEFYQKEKINPFGGCLPLLIQMPILIALFTSLRKFFDPLENPTLNVEHASFLWVPSLGSPDPWVLPLLVATFTFIQSKVSMGNANDQTQKTMLYMMPIMMAWFSRSFPAGLALYWVMYNIMSTMEHYIIRRGASVVKKGEIA